MSKASVGPNIAGALAGLLSFRVLMAFVTSTSVTAAVAGPMAYQASQARRPERVAASAPSTTTTTTRPTDRPTALPAPIDPPTTIAPTLGSSTTQPAVPVRAPAPTTSAVGALLPTGLRVSPTADHSISEAVHESRLFGRLYIYFDAPGVVAVRYWVDDPTATGPPTYTSDAPPFGLGPDNFDVSGLGSGEHSLLAEISTAGSGTYRRLARFTVSG